MIFNIFFIIIGIILLFVYILPLRETTFNIGNVVGVLLGIGFISTALLLIFIKNILLIRIWLILFTLFITIFILTLFSIIIASKKTAKNESTVVVLGCLVKWDKPSLSLIERCRVAAEYMKRNEKAVAVLCGGQGSNEKFPEAECMFDLMKDFGIDESRLYVENKSTSTEENLLFAKKIIEDNKLSKSIAIATSEYHEKRAMAMAKDMGYCPASLPAGTKNYTKPVFFTREVIGIWYMIVKRFL